MTGTPAAAGGAGTAAAAGNRAPTAPSAGAPARQTPAAGDPARPAPAERGRTVVADRAVRRIAERAAAETDLAGRRARVTHGSAVVHGRRADVSVDVRLPYPAVLGEAGEKVRGRMADRVAELSGLTVREATVRVQSLSPDRAAPQPPPAHGSTRSGGRATRRRPWSARRIPAALVALTAAAACAFVLYDILSVHLAGRRPAGPRTEAVDWPRHPPFRDRHRPRHPGPVPSPHPPHQPPPGPALAPTRHGTGGRSAARVGGGGAEAARGGRPGAGSRSEDLRRRDGSPTCGPGPAGAGRPPAGGGPARARLGGRTGHRRAPGRAARTEGERLVNPLRNALNRTLLALTGAVLAAGGAWLALTSDAVTPRLPGWWPAPEAGTVLLDRARLADLRGQGWWTPVVVAGTALALLLCLTWFLAQFRRGGGRRLPLAGSSLTLRSRALAGTVARRAQATAGVDRAHVTLPAGKKRSRARVRVLLEPGAEPGPVLRRLTHGALDEARACLAPHPLAARVRMSVRTTRERRAR